jgi:Ribbon-helix-helix protein, copG family
MPDRRVSVTIRLDPDLLAALDRLAAERSVKRSEATRLALRSALLAELPPERRPAPQSRAQPPQAPKPPHPTPAHQTRITDPRTVRTLTKQEQVTRRDR